MIFNSKMLMLAKMIVFDISKQSIMAVTSLKIVINTRGKLSKISNLVGLYISGASCSEM